VLIKQISKVLIFESQSSASDITTQILDTYIVFNMNASWPNAAQDGGFMIHIFCGGEAL